MSEAFDTSYINKFYQKHLGSDLHPFIPAAPSLKHFHDAVYSLLAFLDRCGELPLFLDLKKGFSFAETNTKKCKVNFIAHTLGVTDIVVRALKIGGKDAQMCQGGIASLSCNLGLIMGKDYNSQYNFNFDWCQSSLAVLESMQEVNNIRIGFDKIRNIIEFYHLYLNNRMDYTRNCFEERSNSIVDLNAVRVLIGAEMQMRRESIFKHAIMANLYAIKS